VRDGAYYPKLRLVINSITLQTGDSSQFGAQRQEKAGKLQHTRKLATFVTDYGFS